MLSPLVELLDPGKMKILKVFEPNAGKCYSCWDRHKWLEVTKILDVLLEVWWNAYD